VTARGKGAPRLAGLRDLQAGLEAANSPFARGQGEESSPLKLLAELSLPFRQEFELLVFCGAPLRLLASLPCVRHRCAVMAFLPSGRTPRPNFHS
jgi:hypothetical protein